MAEGASWRSALPVVATVAAITAYVVWSAGDTPAPVEAPGTVPAAWQLPDRVNACHRIEGPTPADRVQACLRQVRPAAVSDGLREVLDGLSGDRGTLLAADIAVPGAVTHLRDRPDLVTVLLGDDEQAAARALADAGLRGLVVARDLTGALDRDARVLSRLAHHDALEWFQLRYVSADVLVYTARTSSTRVPLATGERLLAGLRARLAGVPAEAQSWTPDSVRLIGAARLQGETLFLRHAVATADAALPPERVVDRALDELAAALRREWDRTVEVRGMGRLADRLADLRLEVHLVLERAPVEPRSRYQIFDLWEIGVDGMMFRQRAGEADEKFTYLPGAEAITHALHTADDFLQYATRAAGWRDRRPWEDARTRLDLIRGAHFLERDAGGGTGAVRLVRGMPEIPMEITTDANIQSMLISGAEWWVNNQFADGSFEYKYWPEQNRQSTEYNEVRHILGIRDLADAYRYRRDPRYLAASAQGIAWLQRYAVADTDPPAPAFDLKGVAVTLPHPPAGTTLYRYPHIGEGTANQKLGTVAVGILALVAYAEASGSHEHDELLRRLGRFTLSQLEENGRFTPYFVPENHPYAKERNDIVPGEAALALGKLAAYFHEPDWVSFYPRFLAYYQPWFRERAARKIPGGRWPMDTYSNQDRLDLVQFGPWSVMAAAQYYALTQDPAAAAFGYEVADWMIDNYQWSSDRSPWPDYVGGYYKLPEELPAMQTFCYSEGTAAAYRLALLHDPARAPRYERATREAIRFLEVMQFDELDSYFAARPEKIRGGIKYEMAQNKIRIDYVGHGLSTLSQWLDLRAANAVPGFSIADPAQLDAVGWDHPSTPEEVTAQAAGTYVPQGRAASGALAPAAAPDGRTAEEGD